MLEDVMRISAYIAAISLLTLVACDTNNVTGSGNITSQVRSASQFQNIDVGGTVDVVITPGAKHSIRVETDDNMQSAISTTASNKTLKIRQNGGHATHATVYITTPYVESVTTHTTGSLTIANGFTTDAFLLTSGSSGTIDIHGINAETLTIQQNGSGTITADGSTNTFNCQHYGQGSIHAYDLSATNAAVAVYSTGSIELSVSNKLFADIMGAGNINYKGNAEVVTNRKGTGAITKVP